MQHRRRHRQRRCDHAADHDFESQRLRRIRHGERFGQPAGLVELDVDRIVLPRVPPASRGHARFRRRRPQPGGGSAPAPHPAPAGSGCSTSVTPALGAVGEICCEIVRRPASLASTMSSAFGRGGAHRGDALPIAVAAELDLEQRPVRRPGGRRRHRLGRPERDGEGGDAGVGRGQPEQAPDALTAGSWPRGPRTRNRAHCGRRRRHGGLQGLPVEARAIRGPAWPRSGRPASLPASRHSAA